MSETNEWYIAEGVKGEGQKPEWLKDNKYKTVFDQAKAYTEMEKALGVNEVPEKYQIENFKEDIDIESEEISSFLSFAKENKLKQSVVNGVFKTFSDISNKNKINEDKEIEKFESTSNFKAENIFNWVENNFSDESKEVFNSAPKTSHLLNLLNESRKLASKARSSTPSSNDNGAPLETIEEIVQEMDNNYEKYKTDAIYRGKVNARIKRAHGEE
jgi:hypothetical protein